MLLLLLNIVLLSLLRVCVVQLLSARWSRWDEVVGRVEWRFCCCHFWSTIGIDDSLEWSRVMRFLPVQVLLKICWKEWLFHVSHAAINHVSRVAVIYVSRVEVNHVYRVAVNHVSDVAVIHSCF